jgi:hypothetical protein
MQASRPRTVRTPWVAVGYLVIGLAVLANGAALVVHIVRNAPLPLALLAFWAAGLIAIVAVLVASADDERRSIARTFVIGAGAGFAATLAYDVAKAGLSQLDPAPWNPFEAFRTFGETLLGPGTGDAAVRATGLVFHLSNGVTFGVAYAFLFGHWASRRLPVGVATGIAWGLFLETFQLVLYPGWLSIEFVDEFRQVSFGGHVVFGAVLGLLGHLGLRRVEQEAKG